MQNEKVPDRTLGGDNDEAHRTTFDPHPEPTAEEVEARQSRETAERLAAVEGRDIAADLLARIEPEGLELYNINHSLEKALLLSIAISLCTTAAVPVTQAGTSDVDGEPEYVGSGWTEEESETDTTRKGKQPLRKVGGLPAGKVGKGRSDKSSAGRTSGVGASTGRGSGVGFWKKPPSHTRGKKPR